MPLTMPWVGGVGALMKLLFGNFFFMVLLLPLFSGSFAVFLEIAPLE